MNYKWLTFPGMVSRRLFLLWYSFKWESQLCGDVWWCVGPDKLCRGCTAWDVAVNAGGAPNAAVSCPFLVCSAWEGREGIPMPGAVPVEFDRILYLFPCVLLHFWSFILVYSKPRDVPGMLWVDLLSVQSVSYCHPWAAHFFECIHIRWVKWEA